MSVKELHRGTVGAALLVKMSSTRKAERCKGNKMLSMVEEVQ